MYPLFDPIQCFPVYLNCNIRTSHPRSVKSYIHMKSTLYLWRKTTGEILVTDGSLTSQSCYIVCVPLVVVRVTCGVVRVWVKIGLRIVLTVGEWSCVFFVWVFFFVLWPLLRNARVLLSVSLSVCTILTHNFSYISKWDTLNESGQAYLFLVQNLTIIP